MNDVDDDGRLKAEHYSLNGEQVELDRFKYLVICISPSNRMSVITEYGRF